MTWTGLTPPYGTIVVDPPWAYRNTSQTAGGAHPAAARHYSTMTAEEVAALPVGDLAAQDAHCYLWITNPLLFEEPVGARILEGWGFRYITLLTWVKEGALGMGYWFRGHTEHVAFGVRGKTPIPVEKRRKNVVASVKTRHSAKPPAFFDLVEAVSPSPFVELFCRQPRFGWDTWGFGYEGATA